MKNKVFRAQPSRSTRVVDKRKAVTDAALELFSRYGLHGTSIDQVAARSGVSKSNLLYYFSSKEELYVTVLRELLQVWLAPLDELDGAQNPRDAIASYIRSKLVLARDQPEASRLFCLEMVQGAPLLRETLAQDVRELLVRKDQLLQTWMAQGHIAAVSTPHLMFTIWATTQHYADFAVQVEATVGQTLQDPEFFEATVQAVQRIVLDGVSLVRQADDAPALLAAPGAHAAGGHVPTPSDASARGQSTQPAKPSEAKRTTPAPAAQAGPAKGRQVSLGEAASNPPAIPPKRARTTSKTPSKTELGRTGRKPSA